MGTKEWMVFLIAAIWGASLVVGADIYGWEISAGIGALGFLAAILYPRRIGDR